MTTNQALAVVHLQEEYPQALIEDNTTGEGGTLRVIDLAGSGDSGGRLLGANPLQTPQ